MSSCLLATIVEQIQTSPDLIEKLRRSVEAFQKWLKRPPNVADLDSDLVTAHLAGYADGRALATVKHQCRCIRHIWQAAVSAGHLRPKPKFDPELPVDARSRESRKLKSSRPLLRPQATGDSYLQLQMRERIAKAAGWYAMGQTFEQIAKRLGVATCTAADWPTKPNTKPIWNLALENATKQVASMIQAQAGTLAVLDEVQTYMRRASLCEERARASGQSLFAKPNGTTTLSTFYETYYCRVRLSDARKGTTNLNKLLIWKWVLVTGDPPLNEITAETLALFRDALSQMTGLHGRTKASANTIRSQLGMVQAILGLAGPPGPKLRDAAGILKQVPWVRPPRPVHRVPQIATLDQLGAIYEAAALMTTPDGYEGIGPALWWRTLIVMAYNTGLRRSALLAVRMTDIDWKNCRLNVAAEHSKTRMGQALPLNETAMRHLQEFRTDRDKLFPWPYTSKKMFDYWFRALQDYAGIPEEEQFGLQTIRRSVATGLWEISPQAAQAQLGHTGMGTTRNFYVQRGGMMRRAMDKLPQPAAFGG